VVSILFINGIALYKMSMNTRCSVLTTSKFRGNTLRLRTPHTIRLSRPDRLVIENKTLWSLGINQKWCDVNKDKCEDLQPSLDLSEVISSKLECLVGETADCDFVSQFLSPLLSLRLSLSVAVRPEWKLSLKALELLIRWTPPRSCS